MVPMLPQSGKGLGNLQKTQTHSGDENSEALLKDQTWGWVKNNRKEQHNYRSGTWNVPTTQCMKTGNKLSCRKCVQTVYQRGIELRSLMLNRCSLFYIYPGFISCFNTGGNILLVQIPCWSPKIWADWLPACLLNTLCAFCDTIQHFSYLLLEKTQPHNRQCHPP